MNQEISSLMDGELPADEAARALKACGASESHKATWLVYHVIGDAMRGHAPRVLTFPTGVIAALRDEPTVLAPRRRFETTFAKVAFAAAASVATIGVVGWIGSQGGQGSPAPMVAKGTSAIQPVANKVMARETAPALDVQDYLAAHRQQPRPELYRPVNNQPQAAAAR
jgi:sigma-E factor negative regulatory protein RseA